jgi:hypothetical protein
VRSGDRAPLEGDRRLLELGDDTPISSLGSRRVTALATDALRERRGHPTVLRVMRGFDACAGQRASFTVGPGSYMRSERPSAGGNGRK